LSIITATGSGPAGGGGEGPGVGVVSSPRATASGVPCRSGIETGGFSDEREQAPVRRRVARRRTERGESLERWT
jgi:hypothetical protein